MLNIVFGFCVFDCIWEHRLDVFLNIFRKTKTTKNPRSVNNFRTDHFVRDFGEFSVLNGPLTSTEIM